MFSHIWLSQKWCDMNCKSVNTILYISIFISHPGNCTILYDIRENLNIHLIIYVVVLSAQNIPSNFKKKKKNPYIPPVCPT